MATVSVSNTDIDAIVGTPAEPKEPIVEATPPENPDDDVEGADGLTPRQKREFTASMLKTIGKKHGQLKSAEEFAAAKYAEAQLAEGRARQLEEENERLKAQLQPAPVVKEPEKPKREDFETQDAYDDARIAFGVAEQLRKREEAAAETARQAEEVRKAEVIKTATANLAQARELVPDFDEVTAEADHIVPDHITVLMYESPKIAELGYHFAKHPEELGKIAILSPSKAKVAFRELEDRVESFAKGKPAAKVETNGTKPSPAPEKAQPTDVAPSRPRASAPITPLSQATSVQFEKPEPEMNIREVISKYQRDNKVNLSRRQRH